MLDVETSESFWAPVGPWALVAIDGEGAKIKGDWRKVPRLNVEGLRSEVLPMLGVGLMALLLCWPMSVVAAVMGSVAVMGIKMC